MSKSQDELKELSRRLVDEIFNRRNLGYAEEALDANFVDHSPPPDLPTDKNGAIARFELLLDASNDLRAEILDVVSDGRRVGIRVRYMGTDTGGFFPGVPATGRRFDIEGIETLVIDDDGGFTERYGIIDMKDAMQQLGLAPFVGDR